MNHRHATCPLCLPPARLWPARGRQPPPNYVRAEPVKEEPPKPVVVEIPKPVPVPGQLKRGAVPISAAIRRTAPLPHARRAVGRHPRGQSQGHRGADRRRLLQRDHDLRLRAGALFTRSTRRPSSSPTSSSSPASTSSASRPPATTSAGSSRAAPRRPAASSSSTSTSSRRGPTSRPRWRSTPIGARTSSSCTPTTTRTWPASPGATRRTKLAQLETSLEQQQALAATTTPTAVTVDKLNFNYGVAGHERPPAVGADPGLRRRPQDVHPVSRSDARSRGARALRRVVDGRHPARQLPGEERHVRRRPALRERRAAPRPAETKKSSGSSAPASEEPTMDDTHHTRHRSRRRSWARTTEATPPALSTVATNRELAAGFESLEEDRELGSPSAPSSLRRAPGPRPGREEPPTSGRDADGFKRCGPDASDPEPRR